MHINGEKSESSTWRVKDLSFISDRSFDMAQDDLEEITITGNRELVNGLEDASVGFLIELTPIADSASSCVGTKML